MANYQSHLIQLGGQCWPTSLTEATPVQRALSQKIRLEPFRGSAKRVAGVDVGFEQNGNVVRAAVVVIDANRLEPVEEVVSTLPCVFPYVPGYLSFRELPAVAKAFDQPNSDPDLVVCDGQGIAHPRRFGIACHLGLLLDKPCFGVAKSKLVGEFVSPKLKRGDYTLLQHNGDTIGAVVCTRDKVKPVFVSPGHKMDVSTSVEWTLALGKGLKLPEPTRLADQLASQRKLRAKKK